MKKKLAIVSVCNQWTREIAENSGISFIVFNDFVADCFEQKKLIKGKNLVKDILVPAIKLLTETVVLFDMETLMHDEAASVLKNKNYELCWLKINYNRISDKASAAEKALHDEYQKQLLMTCETVIDFDKLNMEEGIRCVIKKT